MSVTLGPGGVSGFPPNIRSLDHSGDDCHREAHNVKVESNTMILKSFCQHCDSEIISAQQACQRCGAPSGATILKAPALESGYQLYQNAWRGFAVVYPQGWEAIPSEGAGVTFQASDLSAELELVLLPGQSMMNASQHAELYLATLPDHRGEVLEGSSDHYLRAVFEGPFWQGVISVHLTGGGGTLAVARRRPDSLSDIESAFSKMLASFSPISPIQRQRWTEPTETTFTLDLPDGWSCQSALLPPPTPTGVRQPVARLSAEPTGQIFLAVEPEYRTFVHGELPRKAAENEGFLGMLGRWANNAGHGMAQAMGEAVCPFRGLQPAMENFFLPHWQQVVPGLKLLSYQDHGKPDIADVRLWLPGDIIRVVRLRGIPLGNTGRWMGGHSYFYQAPSGLMSKFEPIFLGVVKTISINPAWQQNEQARSSMMFNNQMAHQNQMNNQWMALNNRLHQQRMNDIAMTGQANTQIHQNNMAIADMQAAGWQNQSSTFNTMQHQTVNGINERDDFINPNTGAVHNLSHHVKNYWDAGQDVIVGSNAQLQPPPTWTPLERWDGR